MVADEAGPFFAPQMRLAQEGAEVLIARSIFNQEGKETAVFHRQAGADNWVHPFFATGDGEPLRAIDAVAIEQGNGGQAQLGRALGELLGKRSAAQKTEGAGGM